MATPVVLIPGDGIGPEVTAATCAVVAAAGARIDWVEALAGIPAAERHGDPLPAVTLDLIRQHRVALKGPCTTPIGKGFRSINVRLRQELDLFASVRPDPRTAKQFAHEDGIALYILEYDTGLRASSWDDVWAGPAREGAAEDIGIRWRVEGTEGMARGTIGWPSYPARTPSTLDFTTTRQPGYWFQPRWKEVWFPDAFIGTMAQLLCALEDKSEPEISGRDNLETIALCEAVFAAATEHRVTTVKEFAR